MDAGVPETPNPVWHNRGSCWVFRDFPKMWYDMRRGISLVPENPRPPEPGKKPADAWFLPSLFTLNHALPVRFENEAVQDIWWRYVAVFGAYLDSQPYGNSLVWPVPEVEVHRPLRLCSGKPEPRVQSKGEQ